LYETPRRLFARLPVGKLYAAEPGQAGRNQQIRGLAADYG